MVALSPRGRPLETVDGDQESIRARGRQLDRLSNFLQETSEVLGRISEAGAAVQDGAAIRRIAESGDDVRARLRKVGEWYGEVAPHVRAYGRAVRRANERMEPLIDEMRRVREALREARDERERLIAKLDQEVSRAPSSDSAGAISAPQHILEAQVAEAREAVRRLKSLLEQLGDEFDAHFDRWDAAFDEAADGISGANRDHGMRDKRWVLSSTMPIFHTGPAIVSMGPLTLMTCFGRGPKKHVGLAPAKGWNLQMLTPEFHALHAQIREAKPRGGAVLSTWKHGR